MSSGLVCLLYLQEELVGSNRKSIIGSLGQKSVTKVEITNRLANRVKENKAKRTGSRCNIQPSLWSAGVCSTDIMWVSGIYHMESESSHMNRAVNIGQCY